MPPTHNSLNEYLNAERVETDGVQQKAWLTSSIIKILLFILGAILLCSIVLILLATALTHTSWFLRRRRSCQRRLDGSNRPKFTVKDFILNYFCIAVEALAINFKNDDETTSKAAKSSNQKSVEKTCEQPSLPLRFQPEKLYGATKTMQRDRYRKASCINLPLHPQQKQYRKKSMLDQFMFTEQRRSSKLSDSNSLSRSNLSIHHSHLVGSDKIHFETSKFPTEDKAEQKDIQIVPSNSTYISSYDQNCGRKTSISTEDSKFFCQVPKDNCLAVPTITRRASATDYELLDNRSTKLRKVSQTPISITITDAQSDLGDSVNVKMEDVLFPSTSGLSLEDPRVTRRNSFLSYSTVLGITSKEDLGSGGAENNISCVVQPVFSEKGNKIESSSSFSNVIHLDQSSLQNKNIDKISSFPKRLPPPITYDWMQFPAGIMAIGIKYLPQVNAKEDQILVTLHAAKNLLSPRLWHKTTFNVQCTISAKDYSETFMVHSKESEFGCLYFLNHNTVSMNIPVQRSSKAPEVNDTEIPKILITLNIFESIPKWSGDREYYHGSCSLSTEELAIGQDNFEHIGWCLVEEAYPVIRLSGDMLISICRNQNKGFVNVRIHEIRNMKFSSCGKWRIENLNNLVNNRSYEITVHACLVHAGHILKAIKATTIHHPAHRSSKSYQTDGLSLLECKIKEEGIKETKRSNSITLNDCYVQFNLPSVKKSFEKHLSVKHGVIIYMTSKLPVPDLIPYECANQLKQMGMTNIRTLHATGECHFGDYGFQNDAIKDINRPPSCQLSQSYAFWNDAGSRNGTRIYQWLSME